jgi:hypothetical protein
MPDLKDIDDTALLEELRRRGFLVSVWNKEDGRSASCDDEESLDGLTEEQRDEVGAKLLELAISRKMEDRLAERGNEFLADLWVTDGEDVVAEVLAGNVNQPHA